MSDERRRQYEEYIANGGKANYQDWKSRTKKQGKQLQENIINAQQNPLYKTINDIIGETTDMDEAQSLLNKFGRDNKIDPSQMKSFLRDNDYAFFNSNGERVKFNPNKVVEDTVESTAKRAASNVASDDNIESTYNLIKNAQRENAAAKEAVKKQTGDTAKQAAKEGVEELGPSNLKKIFNKRSLNIGLNAAFAISDYKDARDQGKGVVGSAVKAGALFAAGEVLQGAMLPVMLASSLPKVAVGALETTQKMTRQMNNMQRIQTFGESYFQDTQQLATMRQAGMEMAKMSQYNLQQSIMGNEAQYMHKL